MALRDLRGGELVSGEFVVREKSLQDFRGKPGRYLCLLLADESGTMEARAWDNAETIAAKCTVGEVVFVQGSAAEYKGKVQLKIVSVEPRPSASLAKFIPALGKERVEELSAKFKQFISSIRDKHLRSVLEAVFGDPAAWERFSSCTAAQSLHSAHLGGLLEHTVNVAVLCEAICPLYPQINRDLLLAAALLHDIGKMDTFELRGAAFEYTEEGNLLSEPVLGERRISAAIRELKDFPPKYQMLLSHLILSHHGQYEFHAPVLPMTLEAVVLHHVDNLEAKTNQVISIMSKEQDPEKVWSEYVRTMERHIYLPRLQGEEDE